MRSHIPKYILRDTLSVIGLPELSNGDTIIIRHGLDVLKTIYFGNFNKATGDNHNKLSDVELYLKLLNMRGSFTIVPSQLKYIATKLESYPITREYLYNLFKTGQITKQAADYILNKYWLGEF